MSLQIDNIINELHDVKENTNHALTYLNSLKPNVPDFVAKWYENAIEQGLCDTILDLVDPVSYLSDADKKVVNWFEQITENDQYHHADDMVVMIFTRMYLFGYEVYVL